METRGKLHLKLLDDSVGHIKHRKGSYRLMQSQLSDASCHEMHVEGSTLVWSSGGVVVKTITIQDSPILYSILASFAIDSPNCLSMPSEADSQSIDISMRLQEALVVFTADSVRFYFDKGQQFVVKLPFAVRRAWPLAKAGMLVERLTDSNASPTIPVLFTVMHPVEEAKAIYISNKSHPESLVSPFLQSHHEIVFVSTESCATGLLVTYDRCKSLVTVFRLLGASDSNADSHFLSLTGQYSHSTDTGTPACVAADRSLVSLISLQPFFSHLLGYEGCDVDKCFIAHDANGSEVLWLVMKTQKRAVCLKLECPNVSPPDNRIINDIELLDALPAVSSRNGSLMDVLLLLTDGSLAMLMSSTHLVHCIVPHHLPFAHHGSHDTRSKRRKTSMDQDVSQMYKAVAVSTTPSKSRREVPKSPRANRIVELLHSFDNVVAVKLADKSIARIKTAVYIESTAVQMCLQAIEAALPPDLYSLFHRRLIVFNSCEKAISNNCRLIRQIEWDSFQITLFSFLHHTITFQTSPKQKILTSHSTRTSTDEDWNWFLAENGRFAISKSIPLTVVNKLNVADSNDRVASLIRTLFSKSSELFLQLHNEPPLFDYLGRILVALNCVYEELKLDVTLHPNVDELGTFLAIISRYLNAI